MAPDKLNTCSKITNNPPPTNNPPTKSTHHMADGFGSTLSNTTLMEYVVPEASVIGVLCRCSEKLMMDNDLSGMVSSIRDTVQRLLERGTISVRNIKMKTVLDDNAGKVAMVCVESGEAEDGMIKLNISISSEKFTVMPKYARVSCGSGNAIVSSSGYKEIALPISINGGHIDLALADMALTTAAASEMLNSL